MDGENYDDGYDGDTGGDTGTIERDDSRDDIRKIVDRQKREKGISTSSNPEDSELHSSGNPHEDALAEIRQTVAQQKADTAKQAQDEANRSNYVQHYDGLEPFAQEAVKNGTTLQGAVKDYAAIETLWRKDPVHAIGILAFRTGLDPRRLAFAAHQMFNGPQGGQALGYLKNQAQMHHHERQIEVFAANPSYPHFQALRMDMAALVQAGKAQDLPQAYQMALAERQRGNRRNSRRASKGIRS